MTAVTYLASATTLLAVVLCVVAFAEMRRERYGRARSAAKISMIASLAFLFILPGALFLAFSVDGPESKATLLAMGISATMNCGVFAIPSGLAALAALLISRKRASALATKTAA